MSEMRVVPERSAVSRDRETRRRNRLRVDAVIRDANGGSAGERSTASAPSTVVLDLDRWRSSSALLIAVVGSVSLVLGFFRLSAQSLWVDEAFTVRALGLPFPEQLVDQYHWLYYSILRPWSAVAGTSEWALRFPSVLAAVAACGLLVVLAHEMFDRRVALWSGLLLATSPFFVKWSQQGRSYTLLVAATLLATLLLLRALGRGTRFSWLCYGIAFSAVILLQPVGALVVVPSHAALALQRRKGVGLHALMAVAVMAAICIPWLFAVSIYAGDFWLARPSVSEAATTILHLGGAAWLGVPLAVIGLVVLRRARNMDAITWLCAWAFAPLVLAAVVSIVKPVFLDRFLIGAAPAYAMLGGIAIAWSGQRLRVLLVGVVAAATMLGLASWYSHDAGTSWRGENWEQAVSTTMEALDDGERVVVVPWWANPAPAYYGAPVAGTSIADSIWVLSWSENGHDLSERERRPLGFGDHRLAEKIQFGWRVSAQHWIRPSTPP